MNFGTPRITEFFDPAWAFGWGKRYANWEFSAGVQHELTDGMSMNVSFFRRVFVNFDAANNRLQNAADFDPYSVTVPADPRLQTSGQTLSGLFEVSAAKYGQQDTITTVANNFGSRQQHWNGIDVTLNARMDNGLLVQGGVSFGDNLVRQLRAQREPEQSEPAVLQDADAVPDAGQVPRLVHPAGRRPTLQAPSRVSRDGRFWRGCNTPIP